MQQQHGPNQPSHIDKADYVTKAMVWQLQVLCLGRVAEHMQLAYAACCTSLGTNHLNMNCNSVCLMTNMLTAHSCFLSLIVERSTQTPWCQTYQSSIAYPGPERSHSVVKCSRATLHTQTLDADSLLSNVASSVAYPGPQQLGAVVGGS